MWMAGCMRRFYGEARGRCLRKEAVMPRCIGGIMLLAALAACSGQSSAPSRPAPAFDPAPRSGASDAFKISAVDRSKYTVAGNIPYAKPQACVLDMIYPKDLVIHDPSG